MPGPDHPTGPDGLAGRATPRRPPDLHSCSMQHEHADTAAYGSAAQAGCWVAIEQPGPWGRVAARQSRLDPVLGAALEAEVSAVGGRLLLIRTPGAHPEVAGARTVLVAYCGSKPWLLSGSVDDLQQLRQVDWAALAAGDRAAVLRSAAWLTPRAGGVLLICTNGRRDQCCSTRARPVAERAGHARPGSVWECSHTGGHRFAPTGVLLPVGRMVARLDTELAIALVDAAADRRLPRAVLGPRHDRGASVLAPAAQVAESIVRAHLREPTWSAITVTDLEPVPDPPVESLPWQPAPEHPHDGDGTRWRVRLRHTGVGQVDVLVCQTAGTPLPESCGKAPVATLHWSAEIVGEAPAPPG